LATGLLVENQPLGDRLDFSITCPPFQPRTSFNGLSLGLGLFIAREVVLAHGGTIEVSSTAEAGTAFTVRRPKHRG
jgi:nitrogen-specific signal transduction histidine kinase